MSRALTVFMTLWLGLPTACVDEEPSSDVSEVVDSTTSEVAAPEAPAEPVDPVDLLQQLPDSVRVRRGACPFECCVYREWVARSPVPVLAAERVASDTLLVLQPGDEFTALTGNVHITSLERVVVAREVFEVRSMGGGHVFMPGDTLFVLDYVGEGFYNVWLDGAIYQPEQFWVDQARWSPDGDAEGFAIGTRETEWWTRIRTRDGREGWITPRGVSIDGTDACA